ncbi:MAG: cyclic nucleotide-binding domain-containing protein [bacterium]
MARFPGEVWTDRLKLAPEEHGADQFVAGQRVAAKVRALLREGRVQEAARELGQVAGEVGDELVDEIADAPPIQRANLVRAFLEARDFARAARCCERVGDHAHAGELFERAGNLDRAAAAFLRAGQLERAAMVLERDLEFAEAAKLYLDSRRFLKAAQNYERAGSFFAAGELYARLAKWSKAAEVLQRVAPREPDYLKATLLLGKLLSAARQPVMAAQCYRLALQTHGLRQDSLEIQYRLAALLSDSDRAEEALRLLRDLADVSPGYRDVEQQLRVLAGEESDVVAGTPVAMDAAAPEVAALGLVAVDADVEFLRRVPLFAELSASELHELLPHWEAVTYAPASVIVRQGDEGRRLFVLKQGSARVMLRLGAPDEQLLRILDEGAFFGELSLIRARPASASVVADGPVMALELDRATFEDLTRANDRLAARVYRVFLETLIDRFVELEAAHTE